jgi:hypothetical protein
MANTKNLLGQKFGKLTVESPSEKEGTRFMWNTVCDCGGTKKVWTSNLTRGKITSCGCSKKPDLIGKRFTYGIIVKEAENRRQANRQEWVLQCDCGNTYQATTAQLTGKISHRTTSCGCRQYLRGKEHHLYSGYNDLSGTIWGNIASRGYVDRKQLEITKEQAYEIFEKQNKKCIYTGWDLSFGSVEKIDGKIRIVGKTASLDRIDSLKCYTIDNIQWVHKDINSMKNSHTEEYFLELCNAVASHRKEVELCK